jgi:hypothetical protein
MVRYGKLWRAEAYYFAFRQHLRGHESQHLLLQLRIHLVRDGRSVGKQQAKLVKI